MEDLTFNKDCLNHVEEQNCIKNISETKMEVFTLEELKNIARKEELCGWSKFKKQELYDFLISNNVDVTKYSNTKPSITINLAAIVNEAARNFAVSKFNAKDGRSFKANWTEACAEGDLEMCEVLATLYPPSAENFSWASYHGRLEILKFLHSIQCPMNEYAFSYAVATRRWNIIKYLIGIGCPIGKSAWYEADDDDMLEFLHKIGCPFDEHVIEEMVGTASEKTLDFMVKIGCPIGPRAASLALCSSDEEASKFILKHLDPKELENPDLCRILKDLGPYNALDAYLYGYDRYNK